jgi:hypothetical protein
MTLDLRRKQGNVSGATFSKRTGEDIEVSAAQAASLKDETRPVHRLLAEAVLKDIVLKKMSDADAKGPVARLCMAPPPLI